MKKFKGIKRPRKKRDYSKAMVWVLAGIMILSVAGFLGGEGDTTSAVTYGDHVITSNANGLSMDVDGRDVSFTYYPGTVTDLVPDEIILDQLKLARVVTVTYDPATEDAEYFGFAQFSLEQAFSGEGKYVIRALTNSSGFGLPELGCANATAQSPVILFQLGNNTGFHKVNDCIIGEAYSGLDIVQLRDALLYGYYGVEQ